MKRKTCLLSEERNKRSRRDYHNSVVKRLATLAVDTEVRFKSATDRAAFSNELTEAIAKLVSKYHDESAPGGRAHRLVVLAHAPPQTSDAKEPS